MNDKNIWFKLSKSSAKRLLAYYGIILIISLSTSVYLVVNYQMRDDVSIFMKALLSAIAFSVVGNSVFYVRKLYKACINLDISHPENTLDEIRQLGVVMYFLLRPLFSVVFAILMLIIFKAGISFMTTNGELSEGFIFTCMFFGFFVGYSAGDIVDVLETTGKSVVNKIFHKDNLNV
jgi:hypothetical protein